MSKKIEIHVTDALYESLDNAARIYHLTLEEFLLASAKKQAEIVKESR